MGASTSKPDDIKKDNLDEWEIIEKRGSYDIARSIINQKQAEIRVVTIDPKRSDDQEMAIYEFRKNASVPIIQALAVQPLESKNKGMCTSERTMKVVTQRIINTWNQFPQLTFPESLYSLRESLEGYRLLSKKAGPFEINDKMMGMNSDGQFKVWANQNFGVNHPEHQKPILTTTFSENYDGVSTQGEMVKNIIQIIEQKNQEGQFPNDFRKKMYQSSSTFSDAQQQLDNYLDLKQINIPTKFHPNLKYITKKGTQNTSNYGTFTQQFKNAQPQLSMGQIIGASGPVYNTNSTNYNNTISYNNTIGYNNNTSYNNKYNKQLTNIAQNHNTGTFSYYGSKRIDTQIGQPQFQATKANLYTSPTTLKIQDNNKYNYTNSVMYAPQQRKISPLKGLGPTTTDGGNYSNKSKNTVLFNYGTPHYETVSGTAHNYQFNNNPNIMTAQSVYQKLPAVMSSTANVSADNTGTFSKNYGQTSFNYTSPSFGDQKYTNNNVAVTYADADKFQYGNKTAGGSEYKNGGVNSYSETVYESKYVSTGNKAQINYKSSSGQAQNVGQPGKQ